MSPKTAVTLLIIMVFLSGVFIVYLFFSSKEITNNAVRVETKNDFIPKEEPKVQDSVSEVQKKEAILDKLEEFRKSAVASSSENTNTMTGKSATETTQPVKGETAKPVAPDAKDIAAKQAKILSDLEAFKNSVKK